MQSCNCRRAALIHTPPIIIASTHCARRGGVLGSRSHRRRLLVATQGGWSLLSCCPRQAVGLIRGMSDAGLAPTQHWDARYVVGSVVVAVIGSWVALQLLKRRTSSQRLVNALFLLAGATCFGGVGVFCMHFLGMQALTLMHPSTGQVVVIHYDPLYTALSLLVVVLMSVFSFAVVGDPLKQEWWRYVIGCVAAAGGVLAMHFMGMMAMATDVRLSYDWAWVLGSVIIGLGVLVVGLHLFFRFRDTWRYDWAPLTANAVLLGVAVCAVHYTGMKAVSYTLPDSPPADSNLPSSPEILILTLSLAGGTCGVALGLLAFQYYQRVRSERAKVRSLVLNAVVFDPTRCLLLTAFNGALPSIVIESAYTGSGVFNDHNGDFLRMLKTSTRWQTCDEYTQHLEAIRGKAALSRYSLDLHRKFVQAARDLAAMCQLQLSELGLLYWLPTSRALTVVMEVNAATTEYITKTSDLRFLPLQMTRDYIQSLGDDIDAAQWVQSVLAFHTNTQAYVSPPEPQLPIPPSSSSVDEPWSFAASADNTPSSAAKEAEAVMPACTLSLGLLFVHVTASGLHVMVPSAGPYDQIPMVPMLRASQPIRELSRLQRDCLRELRRCVPGSLSKPSLPKRASVSYTMSVSSQAEDSKLEDFTAEPSPVHPPAAEAAADLPPPASIIAPLRRLSVPTMSMPGGSSSPRSSVPTGRKSLSARISQSFGFATARAKVSPMASSRSGTRNAGDGGAFPTFPISSAAEIASLQSHLQSAALRLAELVGNERDITTTGLQCLSPVTLTATSSLLPLIVTSMSGGATADYAEERVRWVPLRVFELLQENRGMRPGWVRSLLRDTALSPEVARQAQRDSSEFSALSREPDSRSRSSIAIVPTLAISTRARTVRLPSVSAKVMPIHE